MSRREPLSWVGARTYWPFRPRSRLLQCLQYARPCKFHKKQTVNLLTLRLQWFESTPAQAASRAILQLPERIRR
jgi:hypothetical protein